MEDLASPLVTRFWGPGFPVGRLHTTNIIYIYRCFFTLIDLFAFLCAAIMLRIPSPIGERSTVRSASGSRQPLAFD